MTEACTGRRAHEEKSGCFRCVHVLDIKADMVLFLRVLCVCVSSSGAAIPTGWSQLSRACPHQSLELTVLVRQSNLAELEATLLAVSDPDSAQYGQHLSLEEVNELTAPQPQHVSQILQWLEQAGITTEEISRTPNSDMMTVTCTVKQAEALLQLEAFAISPLVHFCRACLPTSAFVLLFILERSRKQIWMLISVAPSRSVLKKW